MSVADFLTSLGEGEHKVKKMLELDRSVLAIWESEMAVPQYSPGFISCGEELYRAILDPIHFDAKTKQIKPTAFDDILTHGLSVHRKTYTNEFFVKKFQEARVDLFNKNENNIGKPKRAYLGCVIFFVDKLRSLYILDNKPDDSDSSGRLVFIFDTANEIDLSHAEACGHYRSDVEKRRIRSEVFKMVKDQKNLVCC